MLVWMTLSNIHYRWLLAKCGKYMKIPACKQNHWKCEYPGAWWFPQRYGKAGSQLEGGVRLTMQLESLIPSHAHTTSLRYNDLQHRHPPNADQTNTETVWKCGLQQNTSGKEETPQQNQKRLRSIRGTANPPRHFFLPFRFSKYSHCSFCHDYVASCLDKFCNPFPVENSVPDNFSSLFRHRSYFGSNGR